MAASSCTADITDAGKDLADATTKVLTAVKDCQGSDVAKCTSSIAEVVNELGIASKDIEEAVTDCGGGQTKCAQDISDAATALAAATDDVAKAANDCASENANSDCTSDIMAAGEQLGLTGVAITTSLSDCKALELEDEIVASSCTGDITTAGEDLAAATSKILSAIKVCSTEGATKCTEAVSEVVGELATASKDIELAVTDCGGAST
jgi:hypothetical protein